MSIDLLRFLTEQGIEPSKVITDNCIELIQREQVGTDKYGVTLDDAKLTHEQVLQHLLEEQLDGANYIRKALHTASQADRDYAFLRAGIEQTLRDLDQLRGNYPQLPNGDDDPCNNAYSHAIHDAQEELKWMLNNFDSNKVLRDLRQ